jgi:hypothetical protein
MILQPTINIFHLLKLILTDSRHDWPTNGAALAILQFTHSALLGNIQIYQKIE